MDVRELQDEGDYDDALAEIAGHFDAPPARGTPAADQFDTLASLIEAYELRCWPIDAGKHPPAVAPL